MKLNFYSTKDYENKPRLRTPPKQTQSNPTCSELACGELVEPVERVEPISNPAFEGLTQMIEIGLGEFLGITSKFILGILIWLIVAVAAFWQ